METNIGKPILSLTPTHSLHIARIFRSALEGLLALAPQGGGGSLQTVAGGILPPAPLNRLFHSLLTFSALNKLKTCQIFAPFFDSLHAVPVSFMVPKFSLKFATQSSEFECFGKMHLEHILP